MPPTVTRINPDFVQIKRDNSDAVIKAVERLTKRQVLIGIPAENNARSDAPIGNAEIAAINELGSPLQGILPRPHLAPGVQAAIPRVTPLLVQAAKACFPSSDGRIETAKSEMKLMEVGMIARDSVKAVIQANIPPPLAAATIAARLRRTASYKQLSKAPAGKAFGSYSGERSDRSAGAARARMMKGFMGGTHLPLLDTGAYLAAITYVIRDK